MQDTKPVKPKRNRKNPPDWAGDAPAWIVEMSVEYSGVVPSPGNSIDPADHIWTGYDGKLDNEVFLKDDRDPYGALREVVEQIVEKILAIRDKIVNAKS